MVSQLRAMTLALGLAAPTVATAQSFRTADTVLRRMWALGMEQSQVERLAQVLMDSIGPRLSGTPGFVSAVEWLEQTYRRWGVSVRRERYGTWRAWRQGAVHMDLAAPRVQSLEVKLLAWSPGTGGRTVEGDAVLPPETGGAAARDAWLRSLRGKFVLLSPPELMCRAPQELERYARPATVERLNAQREASERAWTQRLHGLELSQSALMGRIEEAGAAGVVTSRWSGGWGVNKIFGSPTARIPAVDLSCEDYGLVFRLASNAQGPRLRLFADASGEGETPMFNVIAELRGTELPNEYVVLSAHLDSWHGATGATDNGTGTITMLEAMRILRESYPRPRRTILVGHWGGEEQGLIGSGAFAEDHPEVLDGLQGSFNQDNGTWRVEYIQAQGFLLAGASLARWIAQLPSELSDSLRLHVPGPQEFGGSDHMSFICRGAPGFRLQSSYPEYRQYTWHTNRDTYDKIVFDDLRQNATLTAMLAYLAAEDPERVPRDRALLVTPGGQARGWARCGTPRRSFAR
jgi:hypothetical protein